MTDQLSELLDGDDAQPYRGARDGEHANPDNSETDTKAESPEGDDTPFVDEEDEDLTLPPRRRISQSTAVLAILLLAALAFGAGVLIQKNHDQGLTNTTTGLGGAAPGGALGGGALPSGAFAGRLGGSPGGGSSTAGASRGGAAADVSPVVIGTVISVTATSITVKDLGGSTHVVHLAKSTTITSPVNHSGLRAGATVSVYGTETSGVVSATNITVR